ncbi:propionyl-CoA:succinate CoA transferase [Sporocytophaga myxococcoides]|uniref:Propionyl-CoA:succinate CoA transferase n=1 Tax=Sporocytophaga myxococcoides TaxID=153721 RepID=A0A098LMD0_9BACT|nr:acetyl-CoA hydrolase/transferase C-terminal domain-containing protein [Sporocytophaga myxococcoides]GAL87669.1 propionyl-CoA:succinate CoA transferase [Sporocytophaga myxococcoides]
MNYTTAEEAIKIIKSNDRVFIHSVAAAPKILIEAMVKRAVELKNVEIIHMHTEGQAEYVKPEYQNNFHLKSLFVGANVREATQSGRADYIPIFLSEIPILFRRKLLPVNVALVQVSPPDRFGYCSLGVSVDTTKAVIETAETVIAQINPSMPRTYGDGLIHISNFNFMIEHDSPIYEAKVSPPTEIDKKIGYHVASLIEDGATLQMGIGNIPNAVLASLTNHKRLGVHSEMFSDGLIPLIEKGVVTGEDKIIDRGKVVATFAMGCKSTYDFMDNNPVIKMKEVSYTNDVANIRKNKKVSAINSAIEIDLTGQVCADSIGTKHYSGVGGQIDFIRGASYSEGGKPIIAFPSVTTKGESKIVPYLKTGAGVVSTRANVHFIVTEYGVVDLFGKSMKERAELLTSIAHPDHREFLEKKFHERFK